MSRVLFKQILSCRSWRVPKHPVPSHTEGGPTTQAKVKASQRSIKMFVQFVTLLWNGWNSLMIQLSLFTQTMRVTWRVKQLKTAKPQNWTRASPNLRCVILESHKVSLLLQCSHWSLNDGHCWEKWFNCRSFLVTLWKLPSVLIFEIHTSCFTE